MPTNAAYSTQPSRGEFPQIGSSWYNATVIGRNTTPCPANLEPGYEMSDLSHDYDYPRPTGADWFDTFYLVLNLRTPINQQDNQVRFFDGTNSVVVDSTEPYNNPRTSYMRQLFDFDVATYCSERYPHNEPPPESPAAPTDRCADVQSSLNWFRV